jgi:hypothetical protein
VPFESWFDRNKCFGTEAARKRKSDKRAMQGGKRARMLGIGLIIVENVAAGFVG